MKLGIVRHFRVIDSTGKRWLNAQEFNEWVEHYERCDIETNYSHPLSQWDACYSSDQQRALKTAGYLFEGKVIKTKLLREIGISSVFRTSWRLPRMTWLVIGRIGCLFNHPSQEGMRAVMVR